MALATGEAQRPATSWRLHGENSAADALPAACSYRLTDLLRHDWYPTSRHGLSP
jgi:hypothetical protein